MGLVKNITDNGMTKSIFRVSSAKEAAAYQSLVDMDMPKCPECEAEMKLSPEQMLFEVENPLTQTMGMTLATFTPKCPGCGAELRLDSEIDLNPAFPSALETLERARKKYAALKAQKAKGGSDGKR